MTTITLKFWSKGAIERIYINDEDSQSLGYFERLTSTQERGRSSYYDRHRIAKGDNVEYSETYRFVGDDDIRDRLIAALGIAEREGDDWHNFTEISKKSRGGYPCWYGNTPKAEAARMRQERDRAAYVI